MRYSLVSRFQGGWFGSILGEGLIEENDQLRWQDDPTRLWTVQGMSGRDRTLPENFSPKVAAPMTPAMAAVLLLPIIFLHYEDPEDLRSRVVDAIAKDFAPQVEAGASATTSEWLAEVLLWSHAISLVLLDTLAPDLFLRQLSVRTHALTTPLVSAIAALPQVLNGTGESRVLQRQWSLELNVDQQTFAWALLCFVTTPESWSVAVARSRRVAAAWSLPWLPALVGAISGCYNSSSGLPFRQVNLLPEAIKSNINQQTQQLFTIWSGGLPSQVITDPVGAIAPAGKLQTRRSRPLISQKPQPPEG